MMKNKEIPDPFRPSQVDRTNYQKWVMKPVDPETLVPEELSIVTPEQFDLAYEEYSRFGPDGLIPIKERWPRIISDVDASKYPALEALCKLVKWTPVSWAVQLIAQGVADPYGAPLEQLIAKKFPFVTPSTRQRICSFALFVNR